MRIFYSLLFLVFCSFSLGCGFKEREQAIRDRTKQLDEREQQILAWEQQLRVKEEELLKREQQVDSTTKQLDVGVYDSTIVGRWLVKMRCTETSCPGSAIGDTKTEHWEIGYQNNMVIVNTILKDKVVRVYNGFLKGNTLELISQKQNETDANISVKLVRTDGAKMEGTRELVQNDGCKILYALEAEKQS